MKRTPVDSSMILSVGHLPQYDILEVEFKNKAVYHYYYVTAEIYKELMEAESVGKAFNALIKGKKEHPDFKGSFYIVPTEPLLNIKPIREIVLVAMIPVIPTNIGQLRGTSGEMLKKPGSFDSHPHQGIVVAISDKVKDNTGILVGDKVYLGREPKFMTDPSVVNDLFLYKGVGYFEAKTFDIIAYEREF